MNSFDVMVLAVLLAAALYGALKGMVRILLGAGAFILALALAAWFHEPLAARLPGWIQEEAARSLAATGIIFFATLAGGAVAIWAIQRLLSAVKLRWVDRLSGAALGVALACFFVAGVMVPLTAFLPPESLLLEQSTVAPYVLRASSAMLMLTPEHLKQKYEEARARVAKAASTRG